MWSYNLARTKRHWVIARTKGSIDQRTSPELPCRKGTVSARRRYFGAHDWFLPERWMSCCSRFESPLVEGSMSQSTWTSNCQGCPVPHSHHTRPRSDLSPRRHVTSLFSSDFLLASSPLCRVVVTGVTVRRSLLHFGLTQAGVHSQSRWCQVQPEHQCDPPHSER